MHDHTVTVSACGRIFFACKKINLSQAFAGQKVGIKEEEDGIWQVRFKDYEIGYFDLDTCRDQNSLSPSLIRHTQSRFVTRQAHSAKSECALLAAHMHRASENLRRPLVQALPGRLRSNKRLAVHLGRHA